MSDNIKKEIKEKTISLLDFKKEVKNKALSSEDKANLLIEIASLEQEIKALNKELKKPVVRVSDPDPAGDMAQRVINEEIRMVSDSEHWFKTFVKEHSVAVSDTGGISFDGEDTSHVAFKTELITAYNKTVINYERMTRDNSDMPTKIHKFASSVLMAEAQKWYFREMKIHRLRCLESIKFKDGVSDDALKEWLLLTTGAVKDYEVSAIKHWIQMVKRKLKGLEVENHIFPVIFGSQGDGKTKAIAKLLQPLKGLTLDYDLVQITDTTLMGSLQDNAAVFFDEMGKAAKADISLLKRMITAKEISARPPYGATVEKIKQNCSFIGASNIPLEDIIKDDEMRRFIEITSVKRTFEQYEQMDQIDATKIWQCVDEDANNKYFYENHTGLCRHQGTLSLKAPILLWAEERAITNAPNDLTKWCDMDSLYKDYSRWMEVNHYEWTGGSLQDFGKKLSRTVKIGVSKRQDLFGKKSTIYKIPKCSTVIIDSLVEKALNDGLF
jgi:hypothetical protein